MDRGRVKDEADQYLREQYTNTDVEQICQICKDILPFKLPNGLYFFETVEFLKKSELKRHHYQNHLCLCPNHSAMFMHANDSCGTLMEHVLQQTDNELAIVLAQQELTIYFTKTHLVDLQTIVRTEQESDEPLNPLVSDS